MKTNIIIDLLAVTGIYIFGYVSGWEFIHLMKYSDIGKNIFTIGFLLALLSFYKIALSAQEWFFHLFLYCLVMLFGIVTSLHGILYAFFVVGIILTVFGNIMSKISTDLAKISVTCGITLVCIFFPIKGLTSGTAPPDRTDKEVTIPVSWAITVSNGEISDVCIFEGTEKEVMEHVEMLERRFNRNQRRRATHAIIYPDIPKSYELQNGITSRKEWQINF